MDLASDILTGIAERLNWQHRPNTPGIPWLVERTLRAVADRASSFDELMESRDYRRVVRDGEATWRKQLPNLLVIDASEPKPISPGTPIFSGTVILLAPGSYSGVKVFFSESGSLKRDSMKLSEGLAEFNLSPLSIMKQLAMARQISEAVLQPAKPSCLDDFAAFVSELEGHVIEIGLPHGYTIPSGFTANNADKFC